jgi:hypothetical protein
MIQNRFILPCSRLTVKEKSSVGPSFGNVAAHTIPFAPSCTGRPPLPPISVATHPGLTELTKMPVPLLD